MAVQIDTLTRVFKYNQLKLADPGHQYTPAQVLDIYSATYPELASAVIDEPVTKGKTVTFTFRRAVSTKG